MEPISKLLSNWILLNPKNISFEMKCKKSKNRLRTSLIPSSEGEFLMDEMISIWFDLKLVYFEKL